MKKILVLITCAVLVIYASPSPAFGQFRADKAMRDIIRGAGKAYKDTLTHIRGMAKIEAKTEADKRKSGVQKKKIDARRDTSLARTSTNALVRVPANRKAKLSWPYGGDVSIESQDKIESRPSRSRYARVRPPADPAQLEMIFHFMTGRLIKEERNALRRAILMLEDPYKWKFPSSVLLKDLRVLDELLDYLKTRKDISAGPKTALRDTIEHYKSILTLLG